jgi:ABC-type lipoprotein export system ATPase subunit
VYELTGVSKEYQKGRVMIPALRGVTAVIGDGEWLAIQGPTGQGKSTVARHAQRIAIMGDGQLFPGPAVPDDAASFRSGHAATAATSWPGRVTAR